MHPDFKVILVMLACFVVPFTLTLSTVDFVRPLAPLQHPYLRPPNPAAVMEPQADPTPLGYTWSLSLYLVPCAVLLVWFLRRKHSLIQKRAFWLTTGLMATLGMLLDILFGRLFFTFPNEGSVIGLRFHGYLWGEGWKQTIPIEEVGFYFFGCLCMLLVYIWGDEYWFGAYNVDADEECRTVDHRQRPVVRRYRKLASFHPWSVGYGLLFFALGWWYKKYGNHPYHEGFPGYWLFMVAVALTPSILFYPVARPFINWRAYSLALVASLFVSLFWEAAVAFPYQWWGYNESQMMGLFINGFSGLPIEEPVLWILASWAIVIIYETIYIVMHIHHEKQQGRLANPSV